MFVFIGVFNCLSFLMSITTHKIPELNVLYSIGGEMVPPCGTVIALHKMQIY